MRWQWSRLALLPPSDLYAALAARQSVFVVEQRCVFQDADGADESSWHLLGWHGAGRDHRLACYLRLVDPGVKFAEPSIGRVLTTAAVRGTGLGRALMHEGIVRAARLHPGCAVRIGAQQRLEAFYASLGFRTASAPYDEDGLVHVEMLRPADPGPARG